MLGRGRVGVELFNVCFFGGGTEGDERGNSY